MRKFVFPLLTIFFSIIAALLLVEASLRISNRSIPYFNILNAFHKADKDLGWVLTPSFTARFKREDFDAVISTDEKGFRKIESKVRPAERARGVMFVGDSFLWGWGVTQGEVFTDVLQDELGPEFRVINRGVTKYGTVQENILLKQQIPVEKPALVGLVFFYNDFSDNVDGRMLRRPYCTVEGNRVALNNYPVASPVLGGTFRQIRKYSYAASFMAYFWDSSAAPFFKRKIKEWGPGRSSEAAKASKQPAVNTETGGAPAGAAQPVSLPAQPGENVQSPPVGAGGAARDMAPVLIEGKVTSLSAEDIKIMEHNLAEMKATCEANGARFFVVYAPDAGELRSLNKSAFFSGMKEICSRLGIDFVDPMPAMRAAQPEIGPNSEPFYFPHDLHWTATAHHLSALLVRDYIRGQYRIQPAIGPGTGTQ